jgi:hypothetical protein
VKSDVGAIEHILLVDEQFVDFSVENGCTAGLPDFSRYNIPKRGEYTKFQLQWQQNIPIGSKIDQVAIKCTFLLQDPSKFTQNWEFWF